MLCQGAEGIGEKFAQKVGTAAAGLQNDSVRPYYEALSRKRGQLLLKRVFDILLSLVLLVLLSPVMLILALAIRLDSPGEVLFRQVRVTQYGQEFRIFKFRTMVANAQQLGTQVTVQGDMRITRVGKLLRKCRWTNCRSC